jgi:hypothetical protein
MDARPSLPSTLGIDQGSNAISSPALARQAGRARYAIGSPAQVLSLCGDLQFEVRQQPRRTEQLWERHPDWSPVADQQLAVAVLVYQVGAVPAARRGEQAATQLVVPIESDQVPLVLERMAGAPAGAACRRGCRRPWKCRFQA